jgi:hypothetical protein
MLLLLGALALALAGAATATATATATAWPHPHGGAAGLGAGAGAGAAATAAGAGRPGGAERWYRDLALRRMDSVRSSFGARRDLATVRLSSSHSHAFLSSSFSLLCSSLSLECGSGVRCSLLLPSFFKIKKT